MEISFIPRTIIAGFIVSFSAVLFFAPDASGGVSKSVLPSSTVAEA